jgi:hypothetical protein
VSPLILRFRDIKRKELLLSSDNSTKYCYIAVRNRKKYYGTCVRLKLLPFSFWVYCKSRCHLMSLHYRGSLKFPLFRDTIVGLHCNEMGGGCIWIHTSLNIVHHYKSGRFFFTGYLVRRTEVVNVALLCGVFIRKNICKENMAVQKCMKVRNLANQFK